ncbi:P-loop containing nucleoside triphosphate hydrolase protein [Hypomontagnella submonticulosa]|nr:P-loop containing nucleoside triphosphate hydrolase protein [Hypomontagnella submonticulosa]
MSEKVRNSYADVLSRQVDIAPVKVSVWTLYRYATGLDHTVLAVSTVCAIGGGAALPLMSVIFGRLAGIFQDAYGGALSPDELTAQTIDIVLYLVYLAVAEFVLVSLSTLGFIWTGERLSCRVRGKFLEACLRQNIGFYDGVGVGEVTTRIINNTNLIQEGISEKLALMLAAVATFASAFIIGFIMYWKLTLVLSSVAVAIITIMTVGSHWVVKYSIKSLNLYAAGGGLADEVFRSIRTAMAFGSQGKLADQYDAHLAKAEKYGFRMQVVAGVMYGLTFLVMYLGYGLAFWQGAYFLRRGEAALPAIVTILLAVMTGTFSVGNVSSNFQALTRGISAANKIFETIDRISPMDPLSTEGKKLSMGELQGRIELKNVRMVYPSRPEVTVLEDVSLVIPAGKVTAIVGASGSGKSTIVNLLHRFYEPVAGQVLLDGHDVTSLNLSWLRRQMPVVSQEPTLLRTSIYQNIAYGLDESVLEADKLARVVEAAKLANAHGFISRLPEGYDTCVGEQGVLLSGGQKQRVAIARAVAGDARILLLDEATSALDVASEAVVQAALDAASEGRTTIVIAHRLSTIRAADQIVVMDQGRIVEQGTHAELIARGASYAKLVARQEITDAAESRSHKKGRNGEKEMEIREKTEVVHGRSSSQSNRPAPDDDIKASSHSSTWALVKFVAKLNAPEQPWMIVGTFCSMLCGAATPTSAVFLAELIVALTEFHVSHDGDRLTRDADFWSLMYVVLAAVQLLAFVGEGTLFAFGSERLTRRVRDRAFRWMLHQDVAYFDSTSAHYLTGFLASNAAEISGLSGMTLGTLLNALTTLVGAVALSLGVGWKLALVTACTIPVLLLCGFLRFWVLAGFQTRTKTAYQEAAVAACEAVASIRLTASLARERDVLGQYRGELAGQRRRNLRPMMMSSALYALSQSLTFLCMALGFWYGGTLIITHEYTVLQFYICFAAIIFGAQSAGTIFSFAPDIGKAREAARSLQLLLERRPTINTSSSDGQPVESMDGLVEFRDCHFSYPSRPDTTVLRGLNLTVRPGQFVALVGPSGCGKSTLISLLLRFYDPDRGGIFVDGVDIRCLDINKYRSFLALVSQEPTLYQGTIRDNILFGTDRKDEVTDDEVMAVCKQSNIHDFVVSLPDGLSTVVGSRGSMLSGGQKQRIAIARALIRNPRLLLLDEATSALDAESEKVVQAALDQAARGRTTIAVAHRLNTIQKADRIYVMDQGVLVEQLQMMDRNTSSSE